MCMYMCTLSYVRSHLVQRSVPPVLCIEYPDISTRARNNGRRLWNVNFFILECAAEECAANFNGVSSGYTSMMLSRDGRT